MLVNLLRVSTIARLCDVAQSTARHWAERSGVTFVRAPVAGQDRTGARQGPCYLTAQQAYHLIDLILPRHLDRMANARAKRYARVQARRLEDSTHAVRHTVGGTGSGRP